MNILKVRMFISAHASNYEQCSWWKVSKQRKRRSCSEIDMSSNQNQANLLEAWAWSCKSTILSLLHNVQGIFGSTLSYFIKQLLNAYEEVTFLWIKPNKSYVMHWTSPKTHHTFIIDEPRWRTSWISTF